MPTPPSVHANPTWVLGFSDAKTFFVGYYAVGGNVAYDLQGLGWSMVDVPNFNSPQQKTAGGRDIRSSLFQNPLHAFTLVFNFLEGDPSLTSNPDSDFRTLYSFYTQRTGMYGEFLYKPRESHVIKQPLALPDGNGYTEIVYGLGPFFNESVQETNNILPTVYKVNSGVYTDITNTCKFQTAGSIAPYTGITFTTTTILGGGDTLAASFDFFYRVHFDKDSYSFEEFMFQLMKVGIGLTHVRI